MFATDKQIQKFWALAQIKCNIYIINAPKTMTVIRKRLYIEFFLFQASQLLEK